MRMGGRSFIAHARGWRVVAGPEARLLAMSEEGRSTGVADAIAEAVSRARSGGAPKYHQKLAEQGKLFVRERLRLLLDDADVFAEEGLLVSALAGDLPADAVVTGVGSIHGRPVAVMANDSTVKAGSWGPHTV